MAPHPPTKKTLNEIEALAVMFCIQQNNEAQARMNSVIAALGLDSKKVYVLNGNVLEEAIETTAG